MVTRNLIFEGANGCGGSVGVPPPPMDTGLGVRGWASYWVNCQVLVLPPDIAQGRGVIMCSALWVGMAHWQEPQESRAVQLMDGLRVSRCGLHTTEQIKVCKWQTGCQLVHLEFCDNGLGGCISEVALLSPICHHSVSQGVRMIWFVATCCVHPAWCIFKDCISFPSTSCHPGG